MAKVQWLVHMWCDKVPHKKEKKEREITAAFLTYTVANTRMMTNENPWLWVFENCHLFSPHILLRFSLICFPLICMFWGSTSHVFFTSVCCVFLSTAKWTRWTGWSLEEYKVSYHKISYFLLSTPRKHIVNIV